MTRTCCGGTVGNEAGGQSCRHGAGLIWARSCFRLEGNEERATRGAHCEHDRHRGEI